MKTMSKWMMTALVGAAMAQAAQAAPKQMVVVVAEGVSPQAVDFGRVYLKTAYEQGATVAFDDLKANGKMATAGNFSPANIKGLLKTAAANGYKTGLVTTDDAVKTAAMFYDTTPEAIAQTQFDVLAGGGRASAGTAAETIKGAGGTAFLDVESLNEEPKGKILALQADSGLSWNLDRDAEKEAGFAELATLALQSLSADNKPFLLVIHDTLLAKALNAKDTPAALEQFKELDGILGDIMGTREGAENPDDFGVAVVATGGAMVPKWNTDLPNERADALYIVSALPMSYAKAGETLKGADDAKLKEFATTRYKGWQLADATRAEIVAGTLAPEAAIRASYEPALKISYDEGAAGATVWTLNAPLGADVAQALLTWAAAKPAQ